MKIGYLVHNLNDPAVARRCEMFVRGGASVVVAGFCRDDVVSPAMARYKPLNLGRAEDAAFARRAFSTLRTAIFHGPLARYFERCDTVCARNLEQLAIARILVGERPLVYECLDIHRSLVGSGLAARAIQVVEGALLRRVDLLLTSSTAFVENHFADTTLDAPVELVENKLLLREDASWAPEPTAHEPSLPVRIGWFGMLRCRRTLDFLSHLAAASSGRVEVLVAGKPSPAELPHLAEVVGATPGMTYHGAYRYEDLPELYGRCHLAWTVDWFEDGLNSSWLLPNRLYEPLAYGVVPIAMHDVEVGRWLAANDAGLLVSSADDAREKILALTVEALYVLQTAALRIDRSKLVAGDEDCRALVRTLAETVHR
ncbi:hypothetical protein [Qipengyuania spongiae]|uniref:Glycosyltransferase n=1 Tax=Qipengyuania spongiae TaxID=2909673 RepID=A0ABY5SY28_9SPHN|nr:hypothetical protein [Qipengyuania spongiae]UVI39065.1 hypothetical protein L1F33_12635 [Qipengyuania spongiae]